MIAYRATPDFNVDLRDVLSRAEGFKNFVYHDSSGVPTLGYGVALILQNAAGQWVVRSNLDPLLASIGIVLNAAQRVALQDAAQFLQNGNTAAAKALFPPPDAERTRRTRRTGSATERGQVFPCHIIADNLHPWPDP